MTTAPTNLAPLLIALPHGLSLGGVTTWAVRVVDGLAARGRTCALLVHPENPDQPSLKLDLHPKVQVFRAGAVPAFGERAGDLSPYIPVYRDAVRSLASQCGQPVVVAPTVHGDCFGVAAAISQSDPDLIRVLGWQHSAIEYDTQVLTRYEPVIAKFVAVSDHIEAVHRTRLGLRPADLHNIPCGVEVSAQPPARRVDPTRPLRLIYTGRVERHGKRVFALIQMSDELARRGIPHQLTVLGDGPAAEEFKALASGRAAITHVPPVTPQRVAELLTQCDAFVLPSRFEGLSLSMLEAMSTGCIPILARTDSGALQAIDPGHNGEIADVSPDADEAAAGLAMADAVERVWRGDRGAMSRAAWRTVYERFSLELHLDKASALIDAAARSPARSWPSGRPCAFSAAPGDAVIHGSGSVPSDGASRLSALLRSLAGRRILLHGAGQHTIQLSPVLAGSPASIVAVTDDDHARAGSEVSGFPIIAPADAGATGATDIIISSWMHQESIYARRQVYEAQGLRVHRIYAT